MPFDFNGIEIGVGDTVRFIDHEGIGHVGVVVFMAGNLITLNVPNISRLGGAVLFYNIPAAQSSQLWSRENKEG